ncbi:MAG: hypothetical protein ACLQBA_20480, partial [Candidatus Binataceae bacterium]
GEAWTASREAVRISSWRRVQAWERQAWVIAISLFIALFPSLARARFFVSLPAWAEPLYQAQPNLTSLTIAWLTRWFNWRGALTSLRPETWH